MKRRTSRLSTALALHEMEMQKLRDEILSRYRLCPATEHLHPDYRRTCEDCLGKTCSRLAERGLDDNRLPLAFNDRPICGAMTRIGAICQNRVVPGKHKCRLHGGKSTGPTTLAGKQRVGDAQRLRWALYRKRQSGVP
ncbi:MAG: HGGxSTG domain-containing protein [Paracoccaceae bacterium]